MREPKSRIALLAAILMAGAFSTVETCSGLDARLPTVRDGITMTQLAFVANIYGGPPCGIGLGYGTVATFSPDGNKFVVVLRKGDIESDTNLYTMLLWETHHLDSERPSVVLRL